MKFTAAIDNLGWLIARHLSAVPEIAFIIIEIFFIRGDYDPVSGLFLSARRGFKKPAQSRTGNINPEWIHQILTPHVCNLHVRLLPQRASWFKSKNSKNSSNNPFLHCFLLMYFSFNKKFSSVYKCRTILHSPLKAIISKRIYNITKICCDFSYNISHILFISIQFK